MLRFSCSSNSASGSRTKSSACCATIFRYVFSEEALQAAHDLSVFSVETADSSERDNLEDLTALETLTIDDADTNEIDDALSLTEQNGTLLIGIHIADAGYYVRPHSVLDKSALARGTTIYLPSGKFPMLPPVIGEDKASLIARAERRALSFFCPY